MLITYRSHHHTFSPNDKDVTFINSAKAMAASRRFLQCFFSFAGIENLIRNRDHSGEPRSTMRDPAGQMLRSECGHDASDDAVITLP
jgi:hypothetical protein